MSSLLIEAFVTAPYYTVLKFPYLSPRNINWSQSQENTSMSSMLGNAKLNQLAKLITPSFSGKILYKRKDRWRDKRSNIKSHISGIKFFCAIWLIFIIASLVDLTLEDEVRGRAGEGGRASNAGRVTHAQTDPLGQEIILCFQCFSLGLHH